MAPWHYLSTDWMRTTPAAKEIGEECGRRLLWSISTNGGDAALAPRAQRLAALALSDCATPKRGRSYADDAATRLIQRSGALLLALPPVSLHGR